ncbi:RE1, partial [Symbiodinium microadriaticum]
PAALSDAEAAEQQLVINASEVFVSPVGQPTVFGPSVQSSTANGNPDSKSALSQKAEARSHGSSASTAGAGPNAEGYPLPETSGKQSPPPGLRAGERQVLTEMKDLMKSMLEQNRSLTEQNAAMSKRLEKLEEERNSMHSATSRAEALEPNHCLGDQTQEGWDDWSHDWQQGWGLTTKESERLPPSVADLDVAVECSTPRNPPSRESRVEVLNTTPQGTPVPPGPPPTGVSEVSGLCPVEPYVHGIGSLGLLFESCGSQSMSAPAMTTQTPTALGHTIAPPIAPPLPPPSVPPLPHLGNPWHEIGNPRDPYAPGDKVWWQVPALEAVRGDQDPASRASDWLEMLRPIMADLSPLSSVWWERVMAEARAWYDRWVVASALDKGCIVPLMSGELSDIRYRRLESRAYAMLQGSVPQTVRDELVASRSMHCVGLLYHVLRTFQPGGLQERTRLLDQLSSPGVASNASDVVSKLRAWNRSLVRAQSMGVSIPDASIMVRGLDVMVEKLLQKHAHINFRCLGARTVLQLDHRPCLAAVQEYAKVLQSEFEMLAVSGVDDSNKKPKINALQNDDSQNPKTKGNPKGLAIGERTMYLTMLGTLVCEEEISPICPLGPLVSRLGCQVNWSDRGISIVHPTRGRLPVVLEGNCPVVSAGLCLELIDELEKQQHQHIGRGLKLKAMAAGTGFGELDAEHECSWGSENRLLEWVRKLSPEGPERILAQAIPARTIGEPSGERVPFNRHVRRAVQKARGVVIHLFSGGTKPREFGNMPHDVYVLNVDLKQSQDLLHELTYQWLATLCRSGKVVAVIGGPPCRLERNSRQDADETVINRLTKDEKDFKAHCESDHVVFRKDCLTCLEAALRGHRHVRQKYLYSNALTLTLDLAGPFKKGELSKEWHQSVVEGRTKFTKQKRPIVPFGTQVTVKQREWLRINGATIVRLVNHEAVKSPVRFVGEEVVDDADADAAQGWTLGFFQHGSMVGITNETKRLIGGCDQAVWFDASKLHAVEESEESRRVVVAYTPRCFVKLPLEDRKLLIDLEFPVPEITYIEDPDPQPTSDQPEKGTSTQAEFFTLLDEDSFELNPNADEDHCSNDAGDASNSFACDVEPDGCVERHRMLRLLISEHQRFLDEELSVGCSGAAEVTSHHLRQLHAAVDAEEAAIIRAHAQVESVDTHGCGEVMRVVGARVAMLKSSSQHVDGHDVQGVPLVPDPDESMPPDMARWVEDGRRVAEQVGSGVPEAAPAHPLQTQIVSPLEVLRNLDDWKESIGEELSSVFEVNQALKRTTRGEVQRWQAEGKVIEYIPGKVLFSRKAGSGRHKTRVLACGNYCSNAKSKDRDRRQTLYAGGIDTLSLRCQLRHCGLHAGGDPTPKGRGEGERPLLQRWTAGVADIRTAFLTAPLEQDKRILIIRPPNTLVRAGVVDAEELWIATGAIYGLEESPAAWSKFRDSKIPTLHITHEGLVYGLKQSESEPNVWLMFRRNENGDLCGELAGVLGVYVDDLLCTGPKPLIQSVFAAVQKEWRISTPQYADEGDGIVFCGLEVRHVDGALRLSQTAYIQSLLERYPHVTGVSSTPYAKEPVFVDQTEPPLLERVRLAQKLVGEVLWVSTRSRPDLCYAVSRLGQLLTKQVEYTITAAENLIRYLRATMHYALVYGNKDHAQHEKGHVGDNAMPLAVDRSDDLVELFADASFSPGVERSQTGVVVTWTGAVLGWMSIRQPTISLSTAEAELNATVDAITLGQSVLPLVRELLQGGVACVTYNDNIGCCTLLQQPQGCWRTRHLRIRAKWCLERLEWRDVSIYHIAGKWMLGDLCTKPLVGQRVRELLTWMCVHTEPSASAANGGESACCDSAPRETSSCDPVGHESGSGGALGSGGACLTSCAQKLRVAVKSLAYAACLQDVWSKRIVVEGDDDLSLTNLIQRVAIIFCVIGVVAYLAWMNGRNSALQARAESDVNREWSLVPGEAEDLTDSQSMSPLDPNPFLHNRSVGVVLGSSSLDSNVDARRDCHAKAQGAGGRLHAEELATAERFLDDIAVSGPEGAVHTVDAWIRDGSFSPSGGIAQVRVTTVEEAEPISSSI